MLRSSSSGAGRSCTMSGPEIIKKKTKLVMKFGLGCICMTHSLTV